MSGARWCPTSSALPEEPELPSLLAWTESPNCLHSRPDFDEEPQPRGGGSFRVIVPALRWNARGNRTAQGKSAKSEIHHGPVAQRIEQQPSKLKVAGSIPAGVAKQYQQFMRRIPRVKSSKKWVRGHAWGHKTRVNRETHALTRELSRSAPIGRRPEGVSAPPAASPLMRSARGGANAEEATEV
jgi:hypothetical protein